MKLLLSYRLLSHNIALNVASEPIPSKVPVVLRRIGGTCIDILSKMSNSKGHIHSATKFPLDEEILMHEVCMTENTQYQ
jgi:hypothetical protein